MESAELEHQQRSQSTVESLVQEVEEDQSADLLQELEILHDLLVAVLAAEYQKAQGAEYRLSYHKKIGRNMRAMIWATVASISSSMRYQTCSPKRPPADRIFTMRIERVHARICMQP